MLIKYSGNIRMNNGATRDEKKKSDLKKFKTRKRFDEIFRVAVVGGTVRLV